MIFIKLHPNVPLNEMVCRIHDSDMQTQDQGQGDLAVLQTAVLFYLFFTSRNQLWINISCESSAQQVFSQRNERNFTDYVYLKCVTDIYT